MKKFGIAVAEWTERFIAVAGCTQGFLAVAEYAQGFIVLKQLSFFVICNWDVCCSRHPLGGAIPKQHACHPCQCNICSTIVSSKALPVPSCVLIRETFIRADFV